MKIVKFLIDYPTIENDVKDEKGKVIQKKGSLVEGGYEKGATAKLNDQLAISLKGKEIVEILPNKSNDNIIDLLKTIDKKLDQLLKK